MPVQPDLHGPAHRLPGREALRVLVADDLEANRKLALLMLGAPGRSCDSVAGGKEPIEAARWKRSLAPAKGLWKRLIEPSTAIGVRLSTFIGVARICGH